MSINPQIFDKNYYYNICLGSEEFKKSKGQKLHPKVKKMIDDLNLKKSMDVLEIGCGRGDTALYVAKKVRSVKAIDYSSAAITIAKQIKKKQSEKVQKKTHFFQMNATKLQFKNNSFDFVLFIDTIDHLNDKEQEHVFKEITRVLKKNGVVFMRSCSNRLLLSYTYKYYTYPINYFLTWLDKKIKGVDYDSLPKDPRKKEEKVQHINEPDFFRLKYFGSNFEEISITAEPGFLKEGKGWRTNLYNFLIAFSPLSRHYPLSIVFGHSFLCTFKRPIKTYYL